MWQWLLFLGYFGLLVFIINRVSFFRFKSLPSWVPSVIFSLKVAAGFALFYIYTFYYTDHEHSDTWKYFDDAKMIYSWSLSEPDVFWKFFLGYDVFTPEMQPYIDQLHGWSNPYTYGLSHDSPTIIRINLVMMFFSGAFYPIHILFMSFLSLAGLKALHNVFQKHLQVMEWWSVAALFMAPSILFWSSGVLKEAPLICALGFFWWSFIRLLWEKKTFTIILVFAASAFVMFWLKEYVLLCCLPAVFFIILCRLFSKISKIILFFGSQLIVLLIALYPGPFFPAGNVVYVINKKQEDFYNVSREMQAGSAIETAPLANGIDLMCSTPKAFSTTFFRPFLWESHGVVALFSAIENAFYLILFLLAIFYCRKLKQMPIMALACVSVLFFSAIIIGNSVPVLGAVVRYKIAALPFLLILCLWIISNARGCSSAQPQSAQ